jgi:hypothetical protein
VSKQCLFPPQPVMMGLSMMVFWRRTDKIA